MKKFFLLFAGLIICSSLFAQPAKDSATKDSTHKVVVTHLQKKDSAGLVKDSLSIQVKAEDCQTCQPKNIEGGEKWLLIFLPVIVFILLFVAMLFFGLSGFSLKDALTENEQAKKIIENKQYNDANLLALKDVADLAGVLPPTIEVSDTLTDASNMQVRDYRPSISRYIAFITSLLTLIIALCMTCFYIYHYISTGCAPDLSSLSTVLIALGIGVVPYAFNKVASAVTANKNE